MIRALSVTPNGSGTRSDPALTGHRRYFLSEWRRSTHPRGKSPDEGDKADDLIQSVGEELLRLVGLSDKLHAYPSQLSGGQQRRVAIARAFIMTPDIILADEPTGDLDVDTEREIMDLFHTMHEKGATIAMVTHSREITGFTDRVVEMTKGRII